MPMRFLVQGPIALTQALSRVKKRPDPGDVSTGSPQVSSRVNVSVSMCVCVVCLIELYVSYEMGG